MTRAVPQHWLLFAGPDDTGLAVQLEPVMSKNGVSLSFTPGPIGERLDIALKTSQDDNTPLTDAFRDLENSAKKGGGCAYAWLQSEDALRCEATFRFQFEEKYLNSGALQNVSGASADLLFGLAVVTAVRSGLDYPPFAATGILNEDGQVLPIEGLRAKINAALEIPALRGKGLIFYPKANDGDIDAELCQRVEQAQMRLMPVDRLEETIECLGIPIQGIWLGNPYRHLEVFEYSHRRIYFGRENEAAYLADKLLQREESGRPSLLILGPSGGGKSSLVRAGLIPELERKLKDRSLLFSVWDLRDAVNKDVNAIAASIRSSWRVLPGLSSKQRAAITPADAFTTLASDLAGYLPDQTCFVWVLDQLEQLFTLDLDEAAEAAFIHFLCELQKSGIWIVATFRNDFYSALQAHDGLLSLFGKDGIHDLEKLSETTIERIIQKPARLAKLEFEVDGQKSERLSLKLKNDAIAGGKDILPLLEFALYQLYEKCELKNGRYQMTWTTYEAMGGLHGAIGNLADNVLKSLDQADQATLGHVLRALTTHRRDPAQMHSGMSPFIARVADLAHFPLETPARRLIDAFGEARLFTSDCSDAGIAQIRVTHEALLTHWPRAVEILNSSVTDLELRERLTDRVSHWKNKGEEPSLLLQPGLLLAEAQDLFVRLGDELDTDTIRYIERSSIAEQEELKKQRRRTRNASITAVILGLLLLVAIGAIYYVNQARNEQTAMLASSYFSEGIRLVDERRPKEALAYLTRAMQLDSNTDSAAARLTSSLLLSSNGINISTVRIPCHDNVKTTQFSLDGRWILVACDSMAKIWDAISGKLSISMLHEDSVRSAQFSPDGRWVVTASEDRTARVWDAATGRPVSQMPHGDSVNSAQFSPDGRWVITASSDNTARVWEAATGIPVSPPMLHEYVVQSAQFSPDGRSIVTVAGYAQVWDSVTGISVSKLMKHELPVQSAQFSPNGRWVVTTVSLFKDNEARVWEATTGEPASKLMQHGGFVNSAQFSLDGRWVITASSDNTARVWEAATGIPVSPPMPHEYRVRSVQFSPDERWVLTVSLDNTVRVWGTVTGMPVSPPMPHGYSVNSAQFSSDGRWVVTVSSDGTAQVWEAATGKPVSQPMQHESIVRLAQFSPDGRWVLTASDDKTARVWETATGKPVSQMPHKDGVQSSAQFSPDGRWVVTASSDKTARVWDAATGRPVSLMPHEDSVRSAQFSPDGRWVATASWDKTARVWDAATGRPVSPPMQHGDSVNSAQFSPNGRWVVTVSDDNTARVWDVATGILVSQPMQHGDPVSSAQFSPDGRWVATASWDKTARVWESVTGRLVSWMQHEDFVWSAQFSPDGHDILTVSNDTARAWGISQLPGNSRGFTEFLEQISGHLINSNNVPQPNDKDSTISELRDWAAAATGLTWEEREFIDWWLSDPRERTVTPTSTQTVKERVQMLIERDTVVSLNEALDYYPGHPMALARLAAATWRETETNQQDDIRPRVALWANLALKYAPEDAAVRAVAEKVLLDIAQPN